jgi:TRAP-type uncharacterized transport system fused permease subunit
MNFRKFLNTRWYQLISLAVIISILIIPSLPVFAATTADVTVTATPSFISIAVDNSTMAFGVVAVSSNYSSANTSSFTIDNLSSIQTDQTIAVTTANWSGGTQWVNSNTATPGADTAALWANKGGAWETGDIIIKSTAPNDVATNQAATTDYSFGLRLGTPTSFTDGVAKSITVRVTAAAG